jgi:hypothetical protein
MDCHENFSSRLSCYLPIAKWLPAYQKQWLSSDLMAGTTLAAFTTPEAIATRILPGCLLRPVGMPVLRHHFCTRCSDPRGSYR